MSLHQIVPNTVCLSCDVCCRFLEQDSFLAPIFTDTERQTAKAHGADMTLFRPTTDGKSARAILKRHKDMFICPFFDPHTSECTIYTIRPLDCQIYPFAVMVNEERTETVLGIDTICPFAEEEWKTEAFQRYVDHIASYLESASVVATIATNWSLVGPYQETVMIVRRLEKLTQTLKRTTFDFFLNDT